jgi:hypothetical protein
MRITERQLLVANLALLGALFEHLTGKGVTIKLTNDTGEQAVVIRPAMGGIVTVSGKTWNEELQDSLNNLGHVEKSEKLPKAGRNDDTAPIIVSQ